ncbi:hypothetical protein AURDEDRAFT_114344 [Auricularia subglabra TFB-10046 SS5]|nr:hypothetical protein AURDEDRAFT_114344 [Auricularia subglabra TFB-10046 SS5]
MSQGCDFGPGVLFPCPELAAVHLLHALFPTGYQRLARAGGLLLVAFLSAELVWTRRSSARSSRCRSRSTPWLDVSTDGAYVWPPARPSQLGLRVHFNELERDLWRVRCPALDRLIVFAAPNGHETTVRPTKLARLVRALGISEKRPTLTPLCYAERALLSSAQRFARNIESSGIPNHPHSMR